jgi:peptide/nickel transport system substrate-binding protein
MASKEISRRKFLIASATGIGGIIFAACAVPTTAPASSTEAPTAGAVSTTVAATAEPTSIPTQAATATPVPTAVLAKVQEAPQLADLVKAGKLPPLDQRLPKVPLTLSPVNTIGKYGGRIHTFSSWLGGYIEECQYGYSPMRWIDDGQGIAPGLCDKWQTNADNSEWTLHMREGIKWSDGQAATMKDTMFWWDDLTVAKEASQFDPLPEFGHDATGAVTKFTLVDDYTLKLTFGTPAPLTAKQLCMWVKGNIGPDRWIAPMHYLKQFHPKYNTAVTDFKTLQDKILFRQNPDCPSLDPWVCTAYTAAKGITWDRNPYYYAVDTEGNQLPYIDGIDEIEVLDKQAKMLQILQGSCDFNNFPEMALSDYATLKDGEAKGGYDTILLDSGSGTGMIYFFNHDHPDKKRRDLYRNQDFRRAMSHAIDRAVIQEKVFYGTGIISNGTFSPKAYEFNWSDEGKAYYSKARQMFSAYDPEKSKTLLDGIGCKVGADGWRTYPDGSKLEVIIDLPATASTDCLAVLDITKPAWNAVGLNIIINSMPAAQDTDRWYAGQGSIHTNWEWADGPDFLVYPDPGTPVTHERWAPLCGVLYVYAGTPQENTEADKSPWDRKPPRYNKNDPEYKGTVYEQLHTTYRKAIVEPDTLKRTQLDYDLWNIHIEHGPMFFGTVANQGTIIIASKKLENVPKKEQYKLGGWVFPWILPNCAMSNPETYSFK